MTHQPPPTTHYPPPTTHQPPYTPHGWLLWLITTAALILIARNPLYTLIILLAVQLVTAVHRNPKNDSFKLNLWRFGLVVITLSTLFNMFSTHFGDTILFRLPAAWPLIGGPITLEAAVYGANNGLILITLLAVFIAFNQIVPVHELVRLTPRALRDLGVVMLIALTYVPETQRHLQKIREAQAIRGHQLRGWRDWRPLILPLLIGGLERAMALAEAMVARGYGATQDTQQTIWAQAGLAAGLAGTLGGWVAALWFGWPGWLLMGSGVLLVITLIWRQGLNTKRTHYRPRPWRLADSWLLLAAVSPPLILFIAQTPSLAYTPYPQLHWPDFNILVGLALTLIALPAALPK